MSLYRLHLPGLRIIINSCIAIFAVCIFTVLSAFWSAVFSVDCVRVSATWLKSPFTLVLFSTCSKMWPISGIFAAKDGLEIHNTDASATAAAIPIPTFAVFRNAIFFRLFFPSSMPARTRWSRSSGTGILSKPSICSGFSIYSNVFCSFSVSLYSSLRTPTLLLRSVLIFFLLWKDLI